MKLVTKIVSCILVIMIMPHDAYYCVLTNEMQSKEIIEVSEEEYIKSNYSKEEREDIYKDAIDKINNNQIITAEEQEVLNWKYEELTFTLPEKIINSEEESEVSIEVNSRSTTAVITSALIRGTAPTTMFNDLATLPDKSYSNGKGGTYNFKNTVSSHFVMPGLIQTTVGNDICRKMVPQGSCYYDGYIFLTAYCQEEYYVEGKKKWSAVHRPVVYVLDATTKEYITTLVLTSKIHAGGITYANGYLWVANTQSDGTGYLFYYNYSQIKAILEYISTDSTVTAVDLSYISYSSICLGEGNKASFICTHNGYIYVGEYYEDQDYEGYIKYYDPEELLAGEVTGYIFGPIPGNANGMVLYTLANKTYLTINANEGYTPSYVYVYEFNNNSHYNYSTYSKKMELPCMIEEAFTYNGRMYFVFESAAYKYRANAINEAVVDEVCGITVSFILK